MEFLEESLIKILKDCEISDGIPKEFLKECQEEVLKVRLEATLWTLDVISEGITVKFLEESLE